MKKRKSSGKARVPAVPVDKFKFCWLHAGAVADGRCWYDFRPQAQKITPTMSVVLTDNPFNRALASIQEHCASPVEYRAVVMRMLALCQLLPQIEKTALMRPQPEGGYLMHESVLERAAVFPLNSVTMEFEAAKFLAGAPMPAKTEEAKS